MMVDTNPFPEAPINMINLILKEEPGSPVGITEERKDLGLSQRPSMNKSTMKGTKESRSGPKIRTGEGSRRKKKVNKGAKSCPKSIQTVPRAEQGTKHMFIPIREGLQIILF